MVYHLIKTDAYDAKIMVQPGENLECLKPEDVNPRLAFHYGLPSSAAMFAYDPVQKILAVSTKFVPFISVLNTTLSCIFWQNV